MIMIMCFFVVQAFACDNTLFISSTGQICELSKCYDTKMHELTLSYGSTLCFLDIKGNTMEISVSDAYDLFRSNLMYYTSDFELKTHSHSVCKGSVYDECWNGSCEKNSKHNSLSIEHDSTKVIGYGCDTDTLGCDRFCYHQTSCTYYRWMISPNGTQYPVYKIINRLWEVNLSIKYRGVIKKYNFNVNNPQINLEHANVNNMPIIITSVSSQINMYENHIIRIGDSFINVDASHINMPETDKVGDIQISTDQKTITYNENAIICQTNSCKPTCTYPSPKINRLISRIENYGRFESKFVNSDSMIISRHRISPQVRLLIGNVDINNLKITPAHCDILVLSTYACTSCTQRPYVILTARNIKNEGLIPFTSNCTFDRNVISCNPDMYKLEVIDGSDACMIYIPSLNQTINMEFRYKYLGGLDPSTSKYSANTNIDDIIDFISNDTLLNTVGITWFGLSLTTIILSAIIKLIKGPGIILPTSFINKKVNQELP
ncbi:glycoprotein [Flen virus]|uniref:Glycoprotein n=1 Tax=Flen virus TaxID=3070912 RepID=A0A5Q0V0P8_9VIRU|nr:glycoprotein [Flen virus]QGA87321.1 glycoprotein [Flen virus]